MNNQSYWEIYRRSSIGLSLIDTLDEFVQEGRIEPQTAMKVLASFDKSFAEVLAEKVKARLNFKGHLDMYRSVDEVWTFTVKDVNFKLDNQSPVHAEEIKIVACSTKKAGET